MNDFYYRIFTEFSSINHGIKGNGFYDLNVEKI